MYLLNDLIHESSNNRLFSAHKYHAGFTMYKYEQKKHNKINWLTSCKIYQCTKNQQQNLISTAQFKMHSINESNHCLSGSTKILTYQGETSPSTSSLFICSSSLGSLASDRRDTEQIDILRLRSRKPLRFERSTGEAAMQVSSSPRTRVFAEICEHSNLTFKGLFDKTDVNRRV